MPSAAILVGGHARRYRGVDKSTLVVEGRRIIDRQIEILRTLTDDIMLVGRSVPGNVPADVRLVADRVPDEGPLRGLEAALGAARYDPVIVLACDMPFVTTPFLQYLLTLNPEADAVVPRTARGYHPLCAVYARACHTAVLGRLSKHQGAVRGFLEDVRVRAVEEEDIGRYGAIDRLLANVNTPAEFDTLEAAHRHTR